jgi:tetratricopeptide (TPR) repeat protein
MAGHHFISYSAVDAKEFALQLCDELKVGPPPYDAWLDKRRLKSGDDWAKRLAEAISDCASMLFVMTPDSVEDESVCQQELMRALQRKKTIIPIRLSREIEVPLLLADRQYIDFASDYETGLASLRLRLKDLASPKGILQTLKDRLDDAERDLRRAEDDRQKVRIQDDIELLKEQIEEQERIVADPQAAAKRVEESIQRGLERERQPEKPFKGTSRSKFINPPPGLAPSYFQDRHVETGMMGDFLRDEALRLMTVVGRGGTGKTALACRLLKSLEDGQLPDNGGPLSVDGIVYLSATGTRRISVYNLYSDLSKLLPDDVEGQLDALYKNPQASTEAKMQALLAHFTEGRTVLLLDNFEDLINPDARNIRDTELNECLQALLTLTPHTVKVIITTRIAPRELSLVQPGSQRRLDLDEGLSSPYAENILREMDTDGKVGLKSAPGELLSEARKRTRGYPRALEALFAILSADRDTSLRDILNDTEKMLPENVVRDLVGEAFSRLDPTAQQVMQALAVYTHPVTTAAVDYLLQPHLPGVNSAPVLSRLLNMQFARKEKGRYYLHPVDRVYAFQRIPEGEESDRDKDENPPYTRFALLHRASEYFKQSRTPPEQWKSIEDLAPQLSEFDLRYAGRDYDTASWVLMEIDFEYLLTWGFYNLIAEYHQRLQGKLKDIHLQRASKGNLGTAYSRMGRYQEALLYTEQSLAISREVKDRQAESANLLNLGVIYSRLGQTALAIERFEQALEITSEIQDRFTSRVHLGNLGCLYSYLGETARAIDNLEQALIIDRDFKDEDNEASHLANLAEVLIDEERYEEAVRSASQSVTIGSKHSSWLLSYPNGSLALARLCAGNLPDARAAAEAAAQYDEPQNNDYVSVLLGLIAFLQGDSVAAQEAFAKALTQADAMLAYSVQNYAALDSRGLALCGLALCKGREHVPAAIAAYKAARAVNKDAGIVKRVLRLFDMLAAKDSDGILAGVRASITGE